MSSSIRRLCMVAFAVLLAAGCQPEKPLPETERPLDLLAKPLLAGASFDPSVLAGKVVLVNFWSPSCGYCVRELPDLQRVADELAPRGLELVTVVTHAGDYERARAVAERAGLRAPIVIADGELQDAFKVSVVPWTVVIDKRGRAVDVVRGGQDGDFFRRLATRYL